MQPQLPSSGHVPHERVLRGRGAAGELCEHAEEPNSMQACCVATWQPAGKAPPGPEFFFAAGGGAV